MHCRVTWFASNGEPRRGWLTTTQLPPTDDAEIPLVIDDAGRAFTPDDLQGSDSTDFRGWPSPPPPSAAGKRTASR